MSRVTILIAVSAVLGAALSASATVHEVEPFDYTLGQSIHTRNGGTGWSTNAWADADTDVVIASTGGSLSYPTGAALESTGSRIELTATDTLAQAQRTLGTSMNLNSATNVFYSSALFRRSALTGETATVNFFDSGGTNLRWGYGITTDGTFRVGVDVNNVAQRSDSAAIAAADTTFLLVAKMRTVSSGSDQVFLKIFKEGDAIGDEPASDAGWDLAASGGSSVTLTQVRLDFANGAGQTNQFDELRVGTSWADVVPEPGALSLLAVATLGMARRRRR